MKSENIVRSGRNIDRLIETAAWPVKTSGLGRDHVRRGRVEIDGQIERCQRDLVDAVDADRRINVVVTAGTVSDDPFDLALAAGDRVRFGRRRLIDGHRVINGTSAKVEHIERDGEDHARIIAWAGRRRLNFSTAELVDERGNVRLSHDYATTVYSSQGLTSESCTVVVDPSYDQHSLCVSASRARGETTLIVNVSEIDAIVVADRRYSERRTAVTVEERRATLLARLSRSQHKTTTLEASDVTELTTRSVVNAGLKRRAKRELGHEL